MSALTKTMPKSATEAENHFNLGAREHIGKVESVCKKKNLENNHVSIKYYSVRKGYNF